VRRSVPRRRGESLNPEANGLVAPIRWIEAWCILSASQPEIYRQESRA
jgi:hypothetical protein